MPVVKIDLWAGRDKETKRKLIHSASKAVADSLGIPVEHVHVILNEASKDNWGLRGEQVSAMPEYTD